MTSPREHQRSHRDIPPVGMGSTYHDWLHYQEKQERRRRREELRKQALRTARNRIRAAKAAKTRRKRRQAQQVASTLRGVFVAGVTVALLIAGNVVRQMWRGRR
jgi:hypothetical protein